MKKSVRKKLTIILVIVVLIVAGVLSYNYNKKGVLLAPTCQDSDGGRNYYVKGKVTTYNSTTSSILMTFNDRCDTQNFLAEYYCSLYSRAIGVNYDCTKENKICSNGACVSVSCNELYSGQDIEKMDLDSSKFNIVFIGNGFRNVDDLKSAAKRVIDMDETSTTPAETASNIENTKETISDGLMQIPVFKNSGNKFNFWYINYTKPFSSKDPSTVWKELYNFDLIKSCQDTLPNRIIPVFIYPAQGNGVGYPYASYGRSYVTLFDCIDSESSCLGGDYPNLQNGNVHELLHTISCLGDEYGKWGNYNLSKAVNYTGTLRGNGVYEYYAGNSYTGCIANAPWKNSIGNGCGNSGSIDCFNANCTQPITYVNHVDTQPGCCLSGMDCVMEIGCFEGGLYSDKGIWRSSSGGVLRNTYGNLNGSQFLNEWDQEIVSKVIQKGPAIGKKWIKDEALNYWANVYGKDCDVTTHDFG